MSRRVHAIRLNGIIPTSRPEGNQGFRADHQYRPEHPRSGDGRFPQKRGGTARHDAVARGYARAADDLGVDIIQNCEVTGLRRNGRRIVGVETSRGFIKTRKVGRVVPAIQA